MRLPAFLLFSLFLAPIVAAEPPVKSPLSPEESLSQFVLSPVLDLRIDLVAAEPNVIDPVAIAFDEQALLYVVEMRDYPNGPAPGEPGICRIRLLEDKDRDGRYETAHDFADGLLFATGVLPWDGGLIVTLAGEVRYFKDTDGDRKADLNEAWFTGFIEENPQLRANHPTLGPDGLIYIANGLRGGKVKAVKEGWPTDEIELRDHDFRFDPRTGKAEAVAGGSQFGLTFDPFGNRFICSNRNPCDHVVLEDSDLARNPQAAIGKPIQVAAPAGNDSHVYPLVNAWTTSTLHSGQFTAACGVTIFTGNALPAACVGNAFTCEPTGSLVQRSVLAPAGGTFVGEQGEKQAEFLASRDSWFRPVNFAVGPDGALYVVDMYRAVIEHPQWMPIELRTRKDLRWGDDRGRIYRVAAKGNEPAALPTLAKATTQELVAALDSPNGWTRDTAARLLLERKDTAAGPLLASLASKGQSPEGRLRAAQLLASLSADSKASIAGLLDDADPRVVAAGVRLGEVNDKLLALAASDDSRVRFEVARRLGEAKGSLPAEQVVEALAKIAARDAGDRWTRAAILTSTTDPLALYDAVVKINADGAVPFLIDLAELVGRRKQKEELAGLLGRLGDTGPEGGWALPILSGFGTGLGGSLAPALQVADERSQQRLAAVFARAAAVAGDETAAQPARQEAVRTVALADQPFALPALLQLASVPDQAVRLAAVRSLARFRDDERIAETLLTDFKMQTPEVRSAILDTLLADPGRTAQVLDAVAAGLISPAELGPTRIAAVSKHRDAAVREQAKTIFAPPADRQKVLAEYGKLLAAKADSERGRAVFQKNCATCHRIGELGTQVGPDIADSRTRTPEALLTDILDPNRAIDGRYMAFSIVLDDGTVQTGLIESETAATVTLAQPEGKKLTIAREQIIELRSDGISLMPVGIERTIPPQEMADLISFIKNWRYLDGAVPLGE